MRKTGWAIGFAGTLGVCLAVLAQAQAVPGVQSAIPPASSPAGAPQQPPEAVSSQPVAGGRLHGVVKSGNVPLPGVTVTAQNTLTGKRFSTTTDITGAWSMTIPQNGRYVVRTQFAAFAAGSGEALLNATNRDQTVDFALMLASRAAAQEQQQSRQADAVTAAITPGNIDQAIQQLTGTGASNLSLSSSLSADTDTAGGQSGATGAELPTIATNSDFSGESVAISGQSGQVSPIAGLDMDRLRDALQTYQAQNGGQIPSMGGLFGGGGGGGLFIGGGGGFGGPGGGGFGGPGGGGGGFGGGRGNFRGFNPAQPHGALAWNGTNSALNAQPFSLRAQSQNQPPSGTNRFTMTLMTEPYLPGLTKPSGKDTVMFTLSGSRSSNLSDQYATVPTTDERNGNFTGLPTIYDPNTGLPFTNNQIPSGTGGRIAPAATALLQYIPQSNITGASAINNYNYHLLTTAQSNSNQAGVRYMRSFGKNATLTGAGGRGGGGGGRGRNAQTQGLRQSISLNYNWSNSASDLVNLFPQLGGKSASQSNSLQAGYTLGYHRLTSISNLSWNRSNSHTTNYFTDTSNNIGQASGVTVPNNFALNYGLPNINLSSLAGISETQPSFSISQTISFSQTVSWIHGKHNFRFGGDYRRVHRDFLAGSNATGNFSFTGWFTEAGSGTAKNPATGSSFADFLLGLPVSTSINASLAKSYLRDNVIDAYAQDDWRMTSSLTVSYGLRYELYAPYTEKFGHLADVLTNPGGGFTTQTEVSAGTVGLPSSLVNPYRKALAPRLGIAYRIPKIKQMVLRAGYGINYTVGEYANFANTMAHQPPFTNEQSNSIVTPDGTILGACALTATPTCFSNGFPAPAAIGNYALDPNYTLPYVQAWNLDIQKTLPLGLVLNAGYNGSRASHLDVKSAPRATPANPVTDPTNLIFTYDQARGFSKFNAGTIRLNKRMSKGIAMGANYQYSHSIDNASAVNGGGGVVAQDWENLSAEEGNSSFDVRHKVSGNYVLELPFGPDKTWITTGAGAHILEGISISGSYTFATGSWLTPAYTATTYSVTCGTAGALRANRVSGVSVTAGGGTLREWFNPAAYSLPTATPGYCNAFGNAPRNSIQGPGTVSNDMSLSKTISMGDTRSAELRANINNVFNTVQYSGVNTTVGTPTFGQVSSAAAMRSFQFSARFRF